MTFISLNTKRDFGREDYKNVKINNTILTNYNIKSAKKYRIIHILCWGKWNSALTFVFLLKCRFDTSFEGSNLMVCGTTN